MVRTYYVITYVTKTGMILHTYDDVSDDSFNLLVLAAGGAGGDRPCLLPARTESCHWPKRITRGACVYFWMYIGFDVSKKGMLQCCGEKVRCWEEGDDLML